MASLTIRNLDDGVKARLRVRAARHGRSMEDEAREILSAAMAAGEEPGRNLARAIRRRFAAVGGAEIDLPARGPMRDPPDLKP